MIFLSFKEMIGGSFKSELYKIPVFHSSFLSSRHRGLVLCHEWQYFFFLHAVLF